MKNLCSSSSGGAQEKKKDRAKLKKPSKIEHKHKNEHLLGAQNFTQMQHGENFLYHKILDFFSRKFL
jgi:hypothetical protein